MIRGGGRGAAAPLQSHALGPVRGHTKQYVTAVGPGSQSCFKTLSAKWLVTPLSEPVSSSINDETQWIL